MHMVIYWGAVLAALALPCPAAELSGLVVGISDGDTLTLLDAEKVQHKIRRSGIDAPGKKQAFGQTSNAALLACAFSKRVSIQRNKEDRYRRKVGRVMSAGTDCSLQQIQSGMAWHYKKYQGEQPMDERQEYIRAEELAQKKRVGLWSDPSPLPPWEFRAR